MLGNLYLHYTLDVWFEREVKPRLGGEAVLVRYCDDFVIGFERREDAQRVAEVLGKRMERSAAIIADAGDLEVGVDAGLRGVVGRDDVVPSPLLVEAEERARALGVVVGDAKRDRGAHPRETVDAFGVGPCALTEAMALLQGHLASAGS